MKDPEASRESQFGPAYIFVLTDVIGAAAAVLCTYWQAAPAQRPAMAVALIWVALASPLVFTLAWRRVLRCPIRSWLTWSIFPFALAFIGGWNTALGNRGGIFLLLASFVALFAPVIVVGACSAVLQDADAVRR